MKTLIKLALAFTILTSAIAAQADWVSGYFRSNGSYVAPYYRSSVGSLGSSPSSSYVYRNPYAAVPSVNVSGYTRSTGTYVPSYVRTPANSAVTDNLSYRGFGAIRMPYYSLGR